MHQNRNDLDIIRRFLNGRDVSYWLSCLSIHGDDIIVHNIIEIVMIFQPHKYRPDPHYVPGYTTCLDISLLRMVMTKFSNRGQIPKDCITCVCTHKRSKKLIICVQLTVLINKVGIGVCSSNCCSTTANTS